MALKLIKRGMDTDEILRRFRYERQILAALEHPHIARLYDGGVSDDGRPFLAMEYVRGQAIDTYCDEKKLGVEERLALFQMVCEAVQYAHQNLVVHRNLKPSNILVTDNGQVKLLDFGIAKLLDEEQAGLSVPVTQTGVRVMTPEYAAPEQVKGEAITTASDVYALGVVLYELLTGHRPYDMRGMSPSEAEQAILEAEPERPSTAVTKATARRHRDGTTEPVTPEQVSAARATSTERLQRRLKGDLDVIVLKALRKEPERRYASAEAFVEDIKRHLAGLPVSARPDTFGYRARKFARRHRFGVAAAVAFVVLIVGFAVAMAFQAQRTADERNKAEEVAAFLENLLAATNPYAPERADTLRMRDFLARGAERVQAELEDQPLVQAQMLLVLGRTYSRLKLYEQAEPLLRQALQLRQTHRGPNHEEVAQALLSLSELRYEHAGLDEAESLAREALRIERRLHGDTHEDVAGAMSNLGRILQETSRYTEAERLHRTALAINEAVFGAVDLKVAAILHNLAMVHLERGRLDSAIVLQRKVVALRRQLHSPEHPAVASALHNLAFYLLAGGAYEEGERHARDALAIQQTAFGETHPALNEVLNLLGLLLRKQGAYDEAEAVHRRALAIGRIHAGEDLPEQVRTLSALATLLREKGDLARAEQAQREALTLIRTDGDSKVTFVAFYAARLAGILQERGKYAEAEALLLESYEAMGNQRENTHLNRTIQDLVTLYEAWGKPDKAAAYQALLDETTS